MNAGIVEHDDRKGLRRLLREQAIESLDDHLRRHGVGGRVVNQLALATQKPQHIETPATRKGRPFLCPPNRAPGIRHGRILRKAGLVEVIQFGVSTRLPLPKLRQQALCGTEVALVAPLLQRPPGTLEAIPQIFLKPA